MSYQYNDPTYGQSGGQYRLASNVAANERADFLRRTYGHLAGAILAFVALEFAFFTATTEATREALMRQWFGNPVTLLVLLAFFIGGGYLAQWWAMNSTSRGMQYAGLGLYVVIEAVIFLPLLWYANDIVYLKYGDATLIPTAGILTALVFGGLTLGVFITGKDFSFLGGFLWIAGFLALGLILCAMIFGFALGMWFSALMIGLACCYILYDTSNVMHRYHTDQYVAAALALFASVALLFFYILRLLIQSREQ